MDMHKMHKQQQSNHQKVQSQDCLQTQYHHLRYRYHIHNHHRHHNHSICRQRHQQQFYCNNRNRRQQYNRCCSVGSINIHVLAYTSVSTACSLFRCE